MKCTGHSYGEIGRAPVPREKTLLSAFPRESVAIQGGETFCSAIAALNQGMGQALGTVLTSA